MSLQTYHDLKKMLCKELDEMTYNGNGRIKNREDLEIIDLLTHSIKSVETVIAMNESENYDSKSGYTMPTHVRRMFDGNTSGLGRSGAQRRDSMGRYSRESSESRDDGYSRHGDMMENLYELMNRARDEHTKMKFQRFIEDLEES